MKRTFIYIKGAFKWNNLLRKFQNLYKRIKTLMQASNYTQAEHEKLAHKMQTIYGKLERMQHKVGVKVAASALLLMLTSASVKAQDFKLAGNLHVSDITIDVGYDSSPAFADIDGDGDLDLYVANHLGNIKYYENEGDGNFAAPLNMQADNADIQQLDFASPEFADIDGDGDLDLYVGTKYGYIKYYENEGDGSFAAPLNMQAENVDIQLYDFASPAFVDIDGDGDLDLYIGTIWNGIKFYQNDGNGNFIPQGDLQDENGAISIKSAYPAFADIDKDGDLDLYIGEEYGKISFFQNDGAGNFLSQGYLQDGNDDIHVGYIAKPSFADMDGDGDLDLYIGNNEGNIKHYQNDGSGNFVSQEDLRFIRDIEFNMGANPAFADIDEDGDLDLYLGVYADVIEYYENKGAGRFSEAVNLANTEGIFQVDYNSHLTFADIDSDGDLDMYIGTHDGDIQYYENDGTGNFIAPTDLQVNGENINVSRYASPEFADVDGDGDLDLYVGNDEGNVKYYKNDGNGEFEAQGDLSDSNGIIDVEKQAIPRFADIDGDGKLDLYIGINSGKILFYKNDGEGNFSSPIELEDDNEVIDVGYSASPVFADMDGDGDLDLYIGNFSDIKYYENIRSGLPTKINKPETSQTQIYSYASVIYINLAYAEKSTISVFDLSGRNVKTLKASAQATQISDLQKGTYIIKVISESGVKTEKVFIK